MHVYEHYVKKFEWFVDCQTSFFLACDRFMKVDDDTYVVMKNLRTFLSQYNPAEPYYFGCFD
jgi:glycoprotein-N-acetylgalactosamine 3-beta-galactosyltransferase